MAKKKDGRVTARANEVRVLRSLQRFGWLRTKDVAALCWTRWASKPNDALNLAPVQANASSLRMAQRTLKRLKLKRCVLASQAPDGSFVYALAEAGVRLLLQLGLQSQSGKDLVRNFSSAFFRHRCISNQIAIAAITQGFRVSTEREIAQGLCPGGVQGIEGKRPDVIVRDGKQAIFCEVERSRKKSAEYQALLLWLEKILRLKANVYVSLEVENLFLIQVIFICTDAFRIRLQKDLEARGWMVSQQETLINYSTTLYNFRDIIFP